MIHKPATSLYEGQTEECMLKVNELLKMRKTMTIFYAQRKGFSNLKNKIKYL